LSIVAGFGFQNGDVATGSGLIFAARAHTNGDSWTHLFAQAATGAFIGNNLCYHANTLWQLFLLNKRPRQDFKSPDGNQSNLFTV
jgi:hypothetical protein